MYVSDLVTAILIPARNVLEPRPQTFFDLEQYAIVYSAGPAFGRSNGCLRRRMLLEIAREACSTAPARSSLTWACRHQCSRSHSWAPSWHSQFVQQSAKHFVGRTGESVQAITSTTHCIPTIPNFAMLQVGGLKNDAESCLMVSRFYTVLVGQKNANDSFAMCSIFSWQTLTTDKIPCTYFKASKSFFKN